MADHALRSGDYLRTSVFLAEAVSKADDEGLPGDKEEDLRLKRARNYLAHAGHAKYLRGIQGVFDTPDGLRIFFQHHIERLRQDLNDRESAGC